MGLCCLRPCKRFFLLCCVVLLLSYGLWRFAVFYQRPLSKTKIIFSIAPGSSFVAIRAKMQQQRLIDDPFMFTLYCWLHAYRSQLKAGDYVVEPSMPIHTFIKDIVQGRELHYAVTIVPGWDRQQILDVLSHMSCLAPLTTEEKNRFWQEEGERYFPDTYCIRAHSSGADLLKMAHKALERELDAAWAQRSKENILATKEEALVLASIIEKESAYPDERFLVSGVFQERLKRGMRLQADPTVRYAHQLQRQQSLTKMHLRTDHQSNTYTRLGLPPAPIAFPSRSALLAAVQPDRRAGFLYFMLQKDGRHSFSRTYQSHKKSVKDYYASVS
jgi:UPF0755 protein